MSNKEGQAEEIVIVRRRGGNEDDHHHGGVWKIAYADFMTAMMAFFLVMWLINASNTETKASIASYFNPIKLTHSVPRKKGLLDVDEKANAIESPKPKSDSPNRSEKAGDSKPKSKDKEAGIETVNDKKLPKSTNTKSSVDGPLSKDAPATSKEDAFGFQDPFNPQSRAKLLAEKSRADPANTVEVKKAANVGSVLNVQAETIRQQLESAAKQIGANGGPGVDVSIEGESIVLSLTDTSNFGMFAVGSAEPNIDTIRMIQSITRLISADSGRVIVRGHTDSRPYRGDRAHNNWRLAMARAEAVYGILVRAGVDERRFERIEGHADRKLRVPNQPDAAENRRIEILLRMSNP